MTDTTKTEVTAEGLVATAPVLSGPRRPDGTKPRRRRRGSGLVTYGRWWWTLPAILAVLAVHYFATATGGFFAFTNWKGLGKFDWIGFDNFVKIFNSPEILASLGRTLFLAFGFVIGTTVLGLIFALALNRTLKSRHILRVVFYLPVVLSPIAVSYVWRFLFDYNGPINAALSAVGLDSMRQSWLANATLAIWCVLIVMIWQSTGFAMVIFLAGLTAVPIEIEEAAAIDGAGPWKRFWNITLPLIRPSIAIASTLGLIQGLRVFDQVMALTNGGPVGATETLATQVYKQTFSFSNFGYGAALALLLTVLILIFAIIQQFLTRDREN